MTQNEVQTLTHALENRFGARVEAEPINGQGRFRFAVVSPQFQGMTQLQRQDAVWAVADATVSRNVTLDISIILAFAPGELETAG